MKHPAITTQREFNRASLKHIWQAFWPYAALAMGSILTGFLLAYFYTIETQ